MLPTVARKNERKEDNYMYNLNNRPMKKTIGYNYINIKTEAIVLQIFKKFIDEDGIENRDF